MKRVILLVTILVLCSPLALVSCRAPQSIPTLSVSPTNATATTGEEVVFSVEYTNGQTPIGAPSVCFEILPESTHYPPNLPPDEFIEIGMLIPLPLDRWKNPPVVSAISEPWKREKVYTNENNYVYGSFGSDHTAKFSLTSYTPGTDYLKISTIVDGTYVEATAIVIVELTNCTCEGWNPVRVSWQGGSATINCGESVPGPIEVAYPNYKITVETEGPVCSPLGISSGSCVPSCDNWYVYKEGNLDWYGSGCKAEFYPDCDGYHAYEVTFTGECSGFMGHDDCPNCSVFMCINCTNITTANCTCTRPTVWNPVKVSWTPGSLPGSWTGKCGDWVDGITVSSSSPLITVDSSIASGSCSGSCPGSAECQPLYTWSINTIWGNPPTSSSSSSAPSTNCHVEFTPGLAPSTSTYEVHLLANCGCDNVITDFCDECIIYLNVTNTTVTENCTCLNWSDVVVTYLDPRTCGTEHQYLSCGQSAGIEIGYSAPIITLSSSMGCTPPDKCNPSYKWAVAEDGSASAYASGDGSDASFKARCDQPFRTYDVTLMAWCDGTRCKDCTVRLNVTCNYTNWSAQYYNYNWTGTPPPDSFSTATFVFARSEPGIINHNWGTGSPGPGVNADYFMASWTGRCCFEAGKYTFSATVDTDAGIEVWVYFPEKDTSVKVIDGWLEPSYTGEVQIPVGWHDVTVKYFERKGNAVCQVSWDRTASW